jgi:hypothetical protein
LNFKKETLKSHKINANNTRIKAFLKLDEVLENYSFFPPIYFQVFAVILILLSNTWKIENLSLNQNNLFKKIGTFFLPFINGLGHQGFLLQFSFKMKINNIKSLIGTKNNISCSAYPFF